MAFYFSPRAIGSELRTATNFGAVNTEVSGLWMQMEQLFLVGFQIKAHFSAALLFVLVFTLTMKFWNPSCFS